MARDLKMPRSPVRKILRLVYDHHAGPSAVNFPTEKPVQQPHPGRCILTPASVLADRAASFSAVPFKTRIPPTLGAENIARGASAPHVGQRIGFANSAIGRLSVSGPH